MISEKTITKIWMQCYSCNKNCNGEEEFVYSLAMLKYSSQYDYYKNIEFKNILSAEDKSLKRTADIIVCENCWKHIAGEDFCFNKDDLNLKDEELV